MQCLLIIYYLTTIQARLLWVLLRKYYRNHKVSILENDLLYLLCFVYTIKNLGILYNILKLD